MERHIHTKEALGGFLVSNGYIPVLFRQNIAGHLLIDAKLNGIDGTFLLDTGAGQTVIDSRQSELLKLNLNHDESEMTGGGVGAHGLENIPSHGNKLEMNDFKIEGLTVAVMSLETAWQSLALVGAAEELYGIIGVNVLKHGNAVIDFEKMTLFLKSK